MTRKRRTFTAEFKCEAACLVLDQGYTISEACRAVGVGETALRRWVAQLELERGGKHLPARLSPQNNNVSKSLKRVLTGLRGKRKY